MKEKKKFSKFGKRSFPKGRNTFMPKGKNAYLSSEEEIEKKEEKKGLYGSWLVKMF